jgi:hypothetical protein
MKFGDYTETRAALAVTGLAIITTLVATHRIGDVVFGSCFCAILAMYTAHCIMDDKWPDAPLREEKNISENIAEGSTKTQ